MGTVRFLLALCVVATHGPGSKLIGASLLSGITAVQAFYVISGFLITMVLNERADYRNIRTFYLSRYLRLWPTYLVVMVLTLVLAWPLMLSPQVASLALSSKVFLWLSNLALFGQDWTLFLHIDGGALAPTADYGHASNPAVNFLIVPQCWTLGVELSFYLIAPFVCRSWRGAALLFAAGLVTRIAMAQILPPAADPWLYRFAPAEMMLFAAGSLSYFAGGRLLSSVPTPLVATIGALCVAIFCALVLGNDVVMPIVSAHFGWYHPQVYLMNAPIISLMVLACPFLFHFARAMPLDAFIGELSYPMYVSHVLVFGVIQSRIPALQGNGNAPYVLAVIAFSVLLYVLVGRPVDRWRHGMSARRISLLARPVAPSAYPSAMRVIAGGKR